MLVTAERESLSAAHSQIATTSAMVGWAKDEGSLIFERFDFILSVMAGVTRVIAKVIVLAAAVLGTSGGEYVRAVTSIFLETLRAGGVYYQPTGVETNNGRINL